MLLLLKEQKMRPISVHYTQKLTHFIINKVPKVRP